MRYFGGKSKIAKPIAGFLESERLSNQRFVDVFCGGLSISAKMKGCILANDANQALIHLYKSILSGWEIPGSLSLEQYNMAKCLGDADPLKAFAGIGCSFAGKWFGGYAREGNRNFARNARNSLLKKFSDLSPHTTFSCEDYSEIELAGDLVYCEPPYAGTTDYKFGKFDHQRFWAWAREASKKNNVFISEYSAPEDFEIALQIDTKLDIRTKDGNQSRSEKLFRLKS